jgi:hypothetical protein
VLVALENGCQHDNEKKLAGWFSELSRVDYKNYESLSMRWNAIRVKQVLVALENGCQHDNEKQLGGWFSELSRVDYKNYESLVLPWSAIKVEQVLVALEKGCQHDDEEGVAGWLTLLFRAKHKDYYSLNQRWNVIRIKRALDNLESGGMEKECMEDDEVTLIRCLGQLHSEGYAACGLFDTRFNIIKVKRAIDTVQGGGEHKEEDDITRLLVTIGNKDKEESSKLRTLWLSAQMERELKNVQVGGKKLLDPQYMARWLADLSKTDPDKYLEFSVRWEHAKARRVIDKVKKGKRHKDEAQMNYWLASVNAKRNDIFQKLKVEWICAQIERVLLAREKGWTRNDESEMDTWLTTLRDKDSDKAQELDKRWSTFKQKKIH